MSVGLWHAGHILSCWRGGIFQDCDVGDDARPVTCFTSDVPGVCKYQC